MCIYRCFCKENGCAYDYNYDEHNELSDAVILRRQQNVIQKFLIKAYNEKENYIMEIEKI